MKKTDENLTYGKSLVFHHAYICVYPVYLRLDDSSFFLLTNFPDSLLVK